MSVPTKQLTIGAKWSPVGGLDPFAVVLESWVFSRGDWDDQLNESEHEDGIEALDHDNMPYWPGGLWTGYVKMHPATAYITENGVKVIVSSNWHQRTVSVNQSAIINLPLLIEFLA